MDDALRLLIERGQPVIWYITDGKISEEEITNPFCKSPAKPDLTAAVGDSFRWTNAKGMLPMEFLTSRISGAESKDYIVMLNGAVMTDHEMDPNSEMAGNFRLKKHDWISIARTRTLPSAPSDSNMVDTMMF